MTGSNVVQRGKLQELHREDARKRPGGIVLRMTWKV